MTAFHSQPNGLLKRQEIETELKISCATIYRWIKSGAFPKPIQLGSNMVRWKATDINAWISSKEECTSQPKTGHTSEYQTK